MKPSQILIIEDDAEISNLVEINLSRLGYDVDLAFDGETGYQKIIKHDYKLIILDLNLPGKDGLEICKKMRAENNETTLLMLTARSEEFDKVLGLELGADDYVTKPFSIRELMARVKALIRRSGTTIESSKGKDSNQTLIVGPLKIEPDKYKAYLDNELLDLTAKEFELLTVFAQNPGHAFSRKELLNTVWGHQFDGYEHTVNSHINRLRAKIEQDPSNPVFIKTVWGIGYRFAEKNELEQLL